jgi:formylglycine-generating enzyme required for sulfatase activity
VGDVLAELGDPRFRADAWYLPDEPLLGFVEIPAGPFVMGTRKANIPALMKQYGGERRWYETETPQHERTLPAYYMARYPVTVAQFQTFVQTSGYESGDPSYRLGVNTHPVVWVSWHDAVAYCRWLTERLRTWEDTPEPLASLLREQGWAISLPSEVQWEKAARGGDGRIFPWGNEPDSNRANYAETEIRAMSAAGCFPGGASPYGVEEMSGNVLEWTQTQWQEGYKNYQVGLAVQGRPVMRSGNFSYSEWSIRCTRRYGYCGSSYRSYGFGFRVACSAPWRTGTS